MIYFDYRDGQPEHFVVQNVAGGERIKIGDPNVVVDHLCCEFWNCTICDHRKTDAHPTEETTEVCHVEDAHLWTFGEVGGESQW